MSIENYVTYVAEFLGFGEIEFPELGDDVVFVQYVNGVCGYPGVEIVFVEDLELGNVEWGSDGLVGLVGKVLRKVLSSKANCWVLARVSC